MVWEAKADMRKGWGPGWGAGKFSRLNCASPSERERVSVPRQSKAGKKKKNQAWLAPVAASGNSRVRPLSPNFPSLLLLLSLSLACVRRKMDWTLGDGKGLIERRDKM
jgi:hypothetical protein